MGVNSPKLPSMARLKSPSFHDRSRRPRRLEFRFLCIGMFCFCLLFIVLLYSPRMFRIPTAPEQASESVCAAHLASGRTHTGFTKTPVDSTVLMLYTPTSQVSSFCYSDGHGSANTTVDQEFLRVAAAYVSSPYTKPSSPYHDFFSAHDATLWTVDRVARVAAPMQLDVVYTYVNPSAPSFERHLKMRNVPFEQRRYRDWEELRYSLRSLRAFMLDNAALAQYHRRHAADVRRLSELGYEVNASGVEEGSVVPLVRRVYLLVSDVDQVPAWLDTEKLPQLRVVTHRDMFTAEEAAWVLPTMNSNVIESGMHRIPDVSRFFLYFTNDMFVGRKMSFFDLFRPLSPMRQRLHLYDLAVQGGAEPEKVAERLQSGDRSVLLLEPVVHSDTQKNAATDREQAKLSAAVTRSTGIENLHSCFLKNVEEALAVNHTADRLIEKTAVLPAYSTTETFALPDPDQGVGRGTGVSMKYFHFIASERFDGLQPPFGYAHVPQLIDREVFRRLADVELFDLTNASRAAYEREMSPYGGINLYAVFAVAMARGAERHIWNTVWRNAPSSVFSDVREELQSWWWQHVVRDGRRVMEKLIERLSRRTELSMFGALYGNTWGAQLQRPDLALEMGYWWVRGAVGTARPSRKLSALKSLYAIPNVALGSTCGLASSKWSARSDDHYYSLLHDMFHHTKRDGTFLFEMVDSEVKTMLIAARLKYEWVDRPLFMGFNDNFQSTADFAETKSVFNTLLKIVSHSCPPAPWERGSADDS